MKEHKPYTIKKVNAENYLVISNDYTRIDDLLPELSDELKKKNIKGEILLDLLLSNGNNNSRFFKIYFNGNKFDLTTLKKTTTPDESILLKINSYLKQNKEILYNSVLPSADVKRILVTL